MKKLISTLAIFIGILAYSQVTTGIRANALFNTSSASWNNFKGTLNGEKESTGFNLGLAFKVDFPVSGWFVMPEIYYTSIKNEAEGNTTTEGVVDIEAKSNRIDVPVLLGHNLIFGKRAPLCDLLPLSIYLQIIHSRILKKMRQKLLWVSVWHKPLLSKFVVNARYEGAFSKDTRKFNHAVSGEEIRYDNRPSMFILGIGYNFN